MLEDKNEELAKLKSLAPEDRAQEQIDAANRRATVVFTAMGAIGQYVWEPRTVTETLDLVEGCVSVAMLGCAIDIKQLESYTYKRLLVIGSTTALDIVTFLALSQKITLPEWDSMSRKGPLLIIRCLRTWCALMEHSEIFNEEGEDAMITLERAEVPIIPQGLSPQQYKENWEIMRELKKRILALRIRMIQQSPKLYHENGLCYLFSRVHQKLMQAMKGNYGEMENEDIQYPPSEEMDKKEVFLAFKKLKIPSDVINLDEENNDDDDDDDDDDTPDAKGHQKKNAKEDKSQQHSKPSTTQKEEKSTQSKGKGTQQEQKEETQKGKGKASEDTHSSKILQSALKQKATSIFIPNPLVGLPNVAPTTTQYVAGKANDPHLELYHPTELQAMPPQQLLKHTILMQDAANASVGLLEGMRLSITDLEETNKAHAKREQESDAALAKATQELLAAQKKIDETPAPPTRGKWGASAQKLAEMTKERDEWREKYLKAEAVHAKSKLKKDLDECHATVKQLKDQMAKGNKPSTQDRTKENPQKEKTDKTKQQGKSATPSASTPQQQPLQQKKSPLVYQCKQQQTITPVQETHQSKMGETDAQALQRVRKDRDYLCKKIKAMTKYLEIAHQRNTEPRGGTKIPEKQLFSLSEEDWIFLHGAIAKGRRWLKDLFDIAQLSKLQLPKEDKEYHLLFTDLNAVIDILREQDYVQHGFCYDPWIEESPFTTHDMDLT